MDKKYFVLHLLPSRPDFAFTMTDEEKEIMEQHIDYWEEKMNNGKVIVFGPVFDPNGPYGLGILVADDEHEVIEFIEKDPAGRINRYKYFPMEAIVPDLRADNV